MINENEVIQAINELKMLMRDIITEVKQDMVESQKEIRNYIYEEEKKVK